MITIYHNPRCSKSRECLLLLEESKVEFLTVPYISGPISEVELENIIKILAIKPIDLVRKNEPIWKEKFKNRKLSSVQIVKAMLDYPELMERPIVINVDKALIGRPPSLVKTIL